MKTLRIAMIGHRFMGRAHSNAWSQMGRFFDPPAQPILQLLCGRDAEATAQAAAKLGWEETSTSWQETIARPDIDAVDICTPGDSHQAIAVAAAQAGKAILCEKPLANSLAEAETMLDAVEKAGVVSMICHNYRRAPAICLAKEFIDQGRLGDIRHFRGTYLQDWIVDPGFPLVWRLQKRHAGSGALGDIASHSIDLARHLVGEISEVSGMLETFVPRRTLPEGGGLGRVDVDDAALALVRFENGAVGTIEATRFATGRKNHNRFEINGSRGSLAFDLERMNELEVYEENGPDSGFRTILATDPSHPYAGSWWPPGHIIGYEHTFTHTLLEFVRAVEGEIVASPDFREGVQNQRVLDAIERSATSRLWEAVSP